MISKTAKMRREQRQNTYWCERNGTNYMQFII